MTASSGPSVPSVTLTLPAWVTEYGARSAHRPLATPALRMAFVVELARRNIAAHTGGPFAAAVFDLDTHRLLAPGVNLVTSLNCSCAHAEIVAVTLAQLRLATYDLGGAGTPRCELVTSTEPCAMCLGAVSWSGVRALVCGARGADAVAIGMDEGTKPTAWADALEQRGITVTRDVCRDAAVKVLQDYRATGGPIYNARQGG